MQMSQSIAKLALAMGKMQAEMPAAHMNQVNPFLRNKFADLGSIIETAKPYMAKNGLSLTQFPTSGENGRIGITSILMHESGDWIADTIFMQPDDEKGKSAAQVAGSIITYLRRYGMASILGMYADEDTDGNATKQEKKPEMTLDQAMNITNSEGVKYADIDTGTLAHIANNAKAPADKRQAAKLILTERAK